MITASTQLIEVIRNVENLIETCRWGVWKQRSRQGTKPEKRPFNPLTGEQAYTNKPDTWGTYPQTRLAAEGYDGVGFLLTPDDPYTVIDPDNVINPDTGEIEEWVTELLTHLDSYAELSPSGTGLHIIVEGELQNGIYEFVDSEGEVHGVEVYSGHPANRFMTFTLKPYPGYNKPIQERQNALETHLHRNVPTKPSKPSVKPTEPSMSLEIGDAELLEKARKANGTGETFKKLYDEGSWLGKGSQSEADLQLCGMLAYWTGCDADRMDRLFRNSKLMRPKWNQRIKDSTYERNTIEKAINGCTNTYNPNYEGKASKPVQAFLAECEQWMMNHPWSGRSGGTQRKLFRGFCVLADQFGTLHESGNVMLRVSQRQLMDAAHIPSKESFNNGLTRLGCDKEVIKKLETGSGTTSSTYLIKLPRTSTSINNQPTTVLITGTPLSETIRVRGKYYRGKPAYRIRIGPRSAHILDLIHASGDAGMSVGDIEQVLGIRKDNLKSRNIPELMEYDLVVEGEDGRYYTPEDVVEALELHLEASKCNRSAEKQKQRHQEEREEDAQKRRGKGTDAVTGEESNDGSQPRYVNQVKGVVCECKAWSVPTFRRSLPRLRYVKIRQHVSGDVSRWRTHTPTPKRKRKSR